MFELMYWVCDYSREGFARQLYLNKNELLRLESKLEENGFIEPVDKLAPMSYVYKSLYTQFIRFYRDKMISRKLPLEKYNRLLTPEQLDELYGKVSDIGFSDVTAGHLAYNKITLNITLVSIMMNELKSIYPALFTYDTQKEIIKMLEKKGLYNYRMTSYVNGLKKYYYNASMRVNKKSLESETEVSSEPEEENVAE